jgi:hypothetical protein
MPCRSLSARYGAAFIKFGPAHKTCKANMNLLPPVRISRSPLEMQNEAPNNIPPLVTKEVTFYDLDQKHNQAS